jgi:hypothetical protein
MGEDEQTRTRTDDRGDADGSADGPARPVRSREDLVAELSGFIAQSPAIFGSVDILNIDYLHPLDRAGILAAVLTGLKTSDHRPAVRSIVVVTAPETDVETADTRARSTLMGTLRLLAGRELPASALEWFRTRFKVISSPDVRSRSLLVLIAEQQEHAAVIVADAANYRDENVEAYIAPGAATPLLPQDVWVPQVHALATASVEVARERKLYVALDTGRLTPTRGALYDLLLSIDGCGVMGSSNEQDLWTILGQRVGPWDQWIREGYLGRVLREIQELPPAFDANKPFLRIQMVHRAGHFNEALQAIRQELELGRNIDPSSRVKLARIAEDANASRLASELLGPAVDQLDSIEDLESALATAHDSGNEELEDRVAARLAVIFPNSPGIRTRKRRIMAAARDYGGIADILTRQGDDQAASFFRELARFLSGTQTPDYLGLIASAAGDTGLAEAFRMACVQDALQRHLLLHAFELALPIPATPQQSNRGERLLVQVLEAIFLWARKGSLPVSDEQLEMAVLALIERLATDPANPRLRVSLAGLVQPSISGSTGLALMAAIVLKLASRPVVLEEREVPATVKMDWLLQRKAFLNAALAWLREQQPVVIGRVVMPDALLTEPADEVVSAVTEYLRYAPIAGEDDVAALQTWLVLGTSVTPHSSDPDFDLQLMRLVGGKLASSGYAQVARDLAEQILLNSTASPRRRRLGWFGMADIYHRCQNHLEGLIAFACALAADDAVDEEQAWYEASALARFFRDCRLYHLARAAIGHSRQHLDGMGLLDRYGHRLDTLELQIRQVEFETHEASNEELEALIVDAVQNGAAVLERHDETAPSAVLIGQLLTLGKKRGTRIASNAEAILAQLCERASGNLASFAATISGESVSATDLFNLAKVRAAARYSDDVGYDMRNVAVLAGRALADDKYIQNAIETSFALELVADHGVAIPGWDEAAKPPSPPEQVEQPAEIARAVSREGISVLQVGFDSNGRLVRLSTIGGHLQAPVREPDDIINEERFKAWAVEYPYRYGIDESSPNLFYTTTANLRLSEMPPGPVVVVADATVQLLPPNVFYSGDDFSGRTHPMAAVPSLAWLEAARQKGGALGDGRLCAWISTAVGGSGTETLPMIAERLHPTLKEYGFTIDNGPTLPEAFAGATMAIITAHGGIHHKEGFFQVVSDEGILKVTPGALAAALRNVGTVILFVCSGGRADKHPGAHTTLGLAKQILDRGCQAVIASPWPLDSRVPSHWLPVFLEHWSRGAPIIHANFAANQIVNRDFALDPAKGLALTVIGNPMVRRA